MADILKRTAPTLIGSVLVLLVVGACSDAPTGPEARVSIRRVGQGHLADISGDRVVWQKFTGGPILAKNLATGQQRVLAQGPDTGQVDQAAISGRRVVWKVTVVVASGFFPPSRIVLGDFDGGDTTLLSGPDVRDVFPDVGERYVVWQRDENFDSDSDSDILAYDTETGEMIPVATGSTLDQSPAVDDGRVVFERRRGVADPDTESTTDVLLFDLATGKTRKLNPNQGAPQGGADISGDIVVWVDNSDGTSDIVYRDLSTGEFVNVTRDRGNASFPAISGSLIAWHDVRNVEPGQQGLDENTDIFAFDIETGEEFPITTAPGRQTFPAVSGDRVVWEDWNGRSPRVFVAEIER